MRQKLRLYRHYVSIVVRGMMQYKTSFLFTAIGQFLVSFNVFLGIYFLFQRFHQVKGYSYSEVLLCYAIVLMEFSLAEMWARGFDTFSGLVRSGEFDRVLVRPQGEILQVLGSRFELTRLGRMLRLYSCWSTRSARRRFAGRRQKYGPFCLCWQGARRCSPGCS